MRILGIDPGVATVGFGVIEAQAGRQQMIQYGAITTPAGQPLAARLVQIAQDMETLITQFQPDEMSIEELFFSKNITTGIAVAQDPDTAREILAREGLVCLGVPSVQGKLVSPGFEGWDALADYTLVEADGSAGKPFKGHEKHEPVLPPRRNTTILVLGADGFGRPISVAAHRPALYARLAGVPENRPVTPAIAARVAAREGFHDQVFVNQVDQEEERPLARQLAERLDCPVAAGSLRSGCWEKIK